MQLLYNDPFCFFSNYLYLVAFIDLLISPTAFGLSVLAADNNVKPVLFAEMEPRAIPS
jgi:hypothetical protein